eukprot:866578-Heterocapsa_arctica.AAC.1
MGDCGAGTRCRDHERQSKLFREGAQRGAQQPPSGHSGGGVLCAAWRGEVHPAQEGRAGRSVFRHRSRPVRCDIIDIDIFPKYVFAGIHHHHRPEQG